MTELAVIEALTAVFLAAAILLVGARRLGLPPIPFYLAAGMLVGPVIAPEHLLELARWGIAFLVFAFAVETDPLTDIDRSATTVGIVQVTATGVLLYMVGLAIGLGRLDALLLAAFGAFSSTLVALGHLTEGPVRPSVTHERLAEAINVVDDLAAIAVILVVGAVAFPDAPGVEGIAAGIGVLAGAVVLRRVLFDRLAAAARGDVEIVMITAVSLLIGFVAIAEAIGISIVVGAFAAGLAVSSEYPHDVEAVDAIGSIEDFFIPVFFVTLGALATVPDARTLGLAGVILLGVIVLNPVVTVLTARRAGYDDRTATLAGTRLDQVSEFSLVIAIEALLVGAIAPAFFEALVLAAIVSMVLSAYTSDHGEAIYRGLTARGIVGDDLGSVRHESTVSDDVADHIIVVGYGPVGRRVVDAIADAGREAVVIDPDPALAAAVGDRGAGYVAGEVESDATWTVARPDSAALIVSAVPDPPRNRRVVDRAGETDVIALATDRATASSLLERGATFVAIPDALAGGRLADHVERTLSEEGYADRLRERGRKRLADVDDK